VETVSIHVLKFTDTPGARYRKDGPFSGEEFREKYLELHFKKPEYDYKIVVYLDGTEGFATSFLEEAFGGLARKYSVERVLRRLEFVSNEDPLLPKEIIKYVKECKGK
jgi:hypothetical protein